MLTYTDYVFIIIQTTPQAVVYKLKDRKASNPIQSDIASVQPFPILGYHSQVWSFVKAGRSRKHRSTRREHGTWLLIHAWSRRPCRRERSKRARRWSQLCLRVR